MAEPRPDATSLHVHATPVAVITAAVVIVALRVAAPVLVPILASLLLSYALEPLVAALRGRGVPRVVSAVIVFALLTATAVIATGAARDEVQGFFDSLPSTVAEISRTVVARRSDAGSLVGRLNRAGEEIRQAGLPPAAGTARVHVVSRRFDLRAYLLAAGQSLFATGLDILTIVILTFLLVATGDLYKRKIVSLAGPTFADHKNTLEVLRAIDRQIARYLLVRLLISAIVATATAAAMWSVGLEHPIMWGIIAGVLNVLPYVGPMIAVALIALAGFVQFKTLEMSAATGMLALVIAALEGNLVTPWLTSRAGEVNTVAVLVAALFWGWLWGLWGLLLAVPILMATKAAADHIEQLKPLGELVSK